MDDLTHAKFAENLNSTFQFRLDDSKTVELVLFEVSELKESARKEMFSILFRGAGDLMLPQRLYSVEHELMGAFDIFLVPVGVNEKGYEYEAVFNRLIEKTSD